MIGAGNHSAIARGTIFSISADVLTLATKGAISPHLLRQGASSQSVPSQPGEQRWPWRLDRDEVASVFVRIRRSLLGECCQAILHAPCWHPSCPVLQAG